MDKLLKPCPFCGALAQLYGAPNAPCRYECSKGCVSVVWQSEEEAREAWNRRTDSNEAKEG